MNGETGQKNGKKIKLRSEELKNNKEEFFVGTFCQIFHKTAQRYPDKTAVTGGGYSVTYQELDEYTNFFAKYLIEQGVKEGDIVAIQTGRHMVSIVGMISIWKAGAAYVFLDDCYPVERNRILQKECG